MRCKRRNEKGTALSEFGPSVFVLLIMLFFPMVNVIGLGVAFTACSTLNSLQVREAAFLPKSDATKATGSVRKSIPDTWKTNGLGTLASVNGNPVTEVSYKDGHKSNQSGVQEKLVVVRTMVTVNPFLAVPFLPGIPGLSAPVQYNFVGERHLENPYNFDA